MKKLLFSFILASELLMVSPLQAYKGTRFFRLIDYISSKITKKHVIGAVLVGSLLYLKLSAMLKIDQGPSQVSGAIAKAASSGNGIQNILPPHDSYAFFEYKGVKLYVSKGVDITKLPVQAIVNAPNKDLNHGGGIALAINTAANTKGCLAKADKAALKGFRGKKNREFRTGDALIVDGCALKSRGINYIVHAVGPSVDPQNITKDDEQKLAESYKNSLEVASEKQVASIAFPTISTNLFHYPVQQATPIALHAVKNYLDSNTTSSIKQIWFAIYGDDPTANEQEKYTLYNDKVNEIFRDQVEGLSTLFD